MKPLPLKFRLRSGDWVTPRRIRIYPLLYLVILLAVTLGAIFFRQGVLDPSGKFLGTDFISFWSASHLLWEGRPEAAYDLAALKTVPESFFPVEGPVYAWMYPPMAFLVIAPLAALPYLPSLSVWLGLTFIGYLTAIWRYLPDRRALLGILAFPPVFINLGHGQNAFLSTALLGWGLLLLPTRPWLAGALLGLLIYKPHLGLLLPVALLASGNWRALLAAGLVVLGFMTLSYVLIGAEAWIAYLEQAGFTRRVLEEGLIPWQKMISVFAAARLWGASITQAWILQMVFGLMAAVLVWRAWRGTADHGLKVAILVISTLVAAPLVWDYDALLLSIALASLTADGFRRGFWDWELSALALAWMLPLFWRPLTSAVAMPLGIITLLLLLSVAALGMSKSRSATIKT